MESVRHRIQEMEGDQHTFEANSQDNYHDFTMDQEPAQNMDEEDDVDITELFHVIDAFSMPRWTWASDVKTFTRVDPAKKQHGAEHGHGYHANGSSNVTDNMSNHILGTAEEKTAMFRARYHVLLQRILRNERFTPPVFTGVKQQQDRFFRLTPIKALKGRSGETFMMFGMLVQKGDGKFCLEDLDGRIELVMHVNVSPVCLESG